MSNSMTNKLLQLAIFSFCVVTATCFSIPFVTTTTTNTISTTTRHMSFVNDGSDYSASESDYEQDDQSIMNDGSDPTGGTGSSFGNMGNVPTVEEEAVPLSKNAGQRFLALVWDDRVDARHRDRAELHELRAETTTEHVMFCRKANLYNETFNYNSAADVFFSYPLLSADLQCMMGHAYCIDANTLEDAQNILRRDPMVRAVVGTSHDDDESNDQLDISNIAFYQWRHMKDHTLRQDTGRSGMPTMVLGFHHEDHDEHDQAVRDEQFDDHLRYLIASERVIMAGPLYDANGGNDDRACLGDLCILNANDRLHAVDFAQNDPLAQHGLYGHLRVHRFNDLDVTGKFQSPNIMVTEDVKDTETEMKEALEYWGYPVDDVQTKWNNR